MKDQVLEIKTALQILKPAGDVFEAIADPGKMANYFISRGSGRIVGHLIFFQIKGDRQQKQI
jgi:uncharacterized protein YndB with AHSA1/START domain